MVSRQLAEAAFGLRNDCLSTEPSVECSIIQSNEMKNIWKPVMEFNYDVPSKTRYVC